MISAHHMQEINKDNRRNLETTSQIKRFQREVAEENPQPGFLSKLSNGIRSLLENIHCHLRDLQAHWRFEI